MRLKDIGEVRLIESFARTLSLDRSVVKGSGDDAAVVKYSRDKYLLLTCDMVIEGVHFRIRGTDPFRIGWKAMARNISDIAAMGGLPRYAMVSMAMDPNLSVAFARRLVRGMNAVSKKFGVNIVGGDVSRSKKLVIVISLTGEVRKDKVVFRSGAKTGDAILLTGSIGGSGKGKHLDFIPRVAEARQLVNRFKINSMIDVSDGLAMDLWRILKASSAGAVIYENAVPLSKEAGSFKEAISEGEDFELLFTMSAKEAKRLLSTRLKKIGTPITVIGEVTGMSSGYRLVDSEGKIKRLGPYGYAHF